MGASSLAGQERPIAARHSIWFTFTAMLTVPAVCLALLWGLAVSAALGDGRFAPQGHRQQAEFALAAGAGLIVIIAAAMLMGSFARRLSRDVRDLASTAEQLADVQSPQPAGRLHDATGARPDGSTRLRHPTTTEIARAAAAVARLRQTATAGQPAAAANGPALVGPPLAGPPPAGTAPDGPAPDGPALVSQPATGTHYGLPRRTRQASLSPHLRDGQPAAAGLAKPGSRPVSSGPRAPEGARDLAASLQSGWQRGRQSDLPDAPPPAGTPAAGRPASTPAAGRPDSTAPDSEDA